MEKVIELYRCYCENVESNERVTKVLVELLGRDMMEIFEVIRIKKKEDKKEDKKKSKKEDKTQFKKDILRALEALDGL